MASEPCRTAKPSPQREGPEGKGKAFPSGLCPLGMWTVCAENGPHASPSPDIYKLKTAPPTKMVPAEIS